MKLIEHDIWFSTLKISDNIKTRLLKELGNIDNVWRYSRDDSHMLLGDNNECRIKEKMKNSLISKDVDYIKRTIYKNEISIVRYNDALFPPKLKYFDDSPCILFYKGDLKKLNARKSAAVVGSRKCSTYGISAAASIVRDLCKYEFNIISGLAKGIDGIAHKSCISNGGYTCGVLGSGLDIVYPRENADLYREMYKNGCVISEVVPGTKPAAYNFPRRNRIISGLSDVVIVVEAGEKSGSLITAGLALDQGKEVFAVPGSIFSETSRGTNNLLKGSAAVYTDISYVLEALKLNFNILDDCRCLIPDKDQNAIFNLLSEKPMHLDEIINITHIDIKQLFELLFELQLDNRILCLPGNYYIRAENE